MEENLGNLLSALWEITDTTENVLLDNFYKLSFESSLKNDQIIFLTSKLTHSKKDLFQFILESLKRTRSKSFHFFEAKVIEFLKEFIMAYPQYCIDNIDYIRQSSAAIYQGENSQIVKEKILSFTAKVIETFPSDVIKSSYEPVKYIEKLLDNIRQNILPTAIKGSIWYIIGILVGKFGNDLSEYKVEVNDVLFYEFKGLVGKTGTYEFKAVIGMLKSFNYILIDCHLVAAQINELYFLLKTLCQPIEVNNSIKVNKLALEVLGNHGKVFSQQIQKDALDLFELVLRLSSHKNYELRIAANEAIEKIAYHISDCLIEENTLHKDTFRFLLKNIENDLSRVGPSVSSMMVTTAISLIGIFSTGIVRFMGEEVLKEYLKQLILICEKDIIKSLGKEAYHQAKTAVVMDYDKRYKPSKTIKSVLGIQKQYISILNSYAQIILNLKALDDIIVEHFYKVIVLGFSTQAKFYSKYKEKLTDSIAAVIVNMNLHQNYFWSFIRKVAKNGFVESIRVTTNMIFKENVESDSIDSAVDFWTTLLTRDKSFTDFTVAKFFDQLFSGIFSLIDTVDISYKECVNENNNVYYEANNVDDLEVYSRTTKFLSKFIERIKQKSSLEKLYLKWVTITLSKFSAIAIEYPRVSVTYTVLSSVMKFCDEVNVFKSDISEESQNFDLEGVEEFKRFALSLVKKVEMFQDELLLAAVELLLSMPVVLMRDVYILNGNNNILMNLYRKSFEIGFNDIRFAKMGITSLEKFFNDPATTQSSQSVIEDILPLFGEYLLEYEKIKANSTNSLEIIDEYTKIQNAIFDILGSIGGSAHKIIRNVSSTSSKNEITNVTNKKNILYAFPLHNKKYNIHFDDIICKVSDICLNSMTKEKKFTSCELLHALTIYIIGKQSDDMTGALVYLIDKILALSCDLEKGISVLYTSLLFEMIHWMSKKGSIRNNKDVIQMLDIIIDNSSNKTDLKLREISSECLAEYIKWFIKQHSDFTVKENSSSIKYLIRKIESNAIHPDPFKRIGASMCFEKITRVIVNNQFLVDKFLLEIVFYVLLIIKVSHSAEEMNEFIYTTCKKSLSVIEKGITKHYSLLSKVNKKRNCFTCVNELFNSLHSTLIANEYESANATQGMYLSLFEKINPNTKINKYWTSNSLWPDMDKENQESIGKYQFIFFLVNNSISELSEIGFKYKSYKVEMLIKEMNEIVAQLAKTMGLNTSSQNETTLKIRLCYISMILRSGSKLATPYMLGILSSQSNEPRNLIDNVFDIVNAIKDTELKIFINDNYVSAATAIIEAMKTITSMILEVDSNFIFEKVEKYLLTKCNCFLPIEAMSKSASENSAKFFFWVVSLISSKLSQEFTERVESNLTILIQEAQPKMRGLLVMYYNYVFANHFTKACQLFTHNELYLDTVADIFINNVVNGEQKINEADLTNFISTSVVTKNISIIFILFEKITSKGIRKLIELISDIFVQKFTKLNNVDDIVNQVKIATLIIFNITSSNLENSQQYLDVTMKVIDSYISEKSITVIKEVMNLLGVIVKIDSSSNVKQKYQIIQSRYFPINTKCLLPKTKEWNDFQLIFDCLLSTFRNVQTFDFLEILFPILREEDSEYQIKVKVSLREYIQNITTDEEIQKSLNAFLNKSIDINPRDNIRYSIMKLIVFKYIKRQNSKRLGDLLITNFTKMKQILDEANAVLGEPNETADRKFLAVLDKTYVFKFLNMILDRIETDEYKTRVHKTIYGNSSQGNEITKYLILELHNSKKRKISGWSEIIKEVRFSEYNSKDIEKYVMKTENNLYCSAYNCLSSLIRLTQTKIDTYVKFLFKTLDNSDNLFGVLISSSFEYNFPIETNFQVKELNKKKSKEDVVVKRRDSKKMIIDTLVTDSFFHDAYGSSIKETLGFDHKSFSFDFIDKIKNGIGITIGDNPEEQKTITIEEDYINKHPIMSQMILLLNHMNKLFPPSPNSNALPPHLQEIYNIMNSSDVSLNQQIFFIKLIMNTFDIFQRYFDVFVLPLIQFISKKQKCGKGFNYFIRDISTFIISSKVKLPRSQVNIALVSEFINSLVKISGDTKNIIFKTNLRIIDDLISQFRECLYLKRETVLNMLKVDDKKQGSHIWKIGIVQVLASAIEYDIPIGEDDDSSSLDNRFINSIQKPTNNDILSLIKNLLNNNRAPVVSSAIELMAKILNKYFQNNNTKVNVFEFFQDALFMQCTSATEKVRVNCISRTALHFPMILKQKEIFNIALQLLHKASSQKQRVLILSAFTQFTSEIVTKHLSDKSYFIYISDIHDTLYQSADSIFIDPSDELIINIISVIENFLPYSDEKLSRGINLIVSKIQNSIAKKPQEIREAYYIFITKCFKAVSTYDRDLMNFLFNVILNNFDNETDQDLMKIFIRFFNEDNANVIPLNPVERLIFVLNCLEVKNDDKLIQLLAKITLVLIYTSADYEVPIYEKGLEECVYRDLNVNTSGYYLNRSQPLAPSVIIRNTMDEAYETLLVASVDQNSQMMIKSTVGNTMFGNTSNSMQVDNDPVIDQNILMRKRLNYLTSYSSLVNVSNSFQMNGLESDDVNMTQISTEPPSNSISFEGFKIPLSLGRPPRKKKKRYGTLFFDNDISYTPIDNINQNRSIRFIPEGAYRHKKATPNDMIYKWANRQNIIHKNQVKLLRKYRVGDLPDIQIKNKDILDPLLAVCNSNSDITSELFLDLMTSIYTESLSMTKNNSLEEQIEKIISSDVNNYLVINCLHRVLYQFMKENPNYAPSLEIIKKSGLKSKNYHTSIMILEEYINNNSSIIESNGSFKNVSKHKSHFYKNETLGKCDININSITHDAWAMLLKFYSLLHITDVQYGIIQNFSLNSEYYIKSENDFLVQLSFLLAKPAETNEINIKKSDLLKSVFRLHSQKDVVPEIGQLNMKYSTDIFKSEPLIEVIEDYALSSCCDLGEWDNIANYIQTNNKVNAHPNEYIKSLIYTSNSYSTNVIENFSKEEADANSFYLSLYFGKMQDFDNSYLYYQKAKSNFYKQWLNFGKYSNNDLKHEIIQEIQRIFEVGEFLGFIKGTKATNINITGENEPQISEVGIKNILSLANNWLYRWPNYIYDEPKAYEEIFSMRELLNDILSNKLTNFTQVVSMNPTLESFTNREHIEIAKKLYKKNAFDLSNKHISTALNSRNTSDYSFILYPFLKNKCRIQEIASINEENTSTSKINYYDKFIIILNKQISNVGLNEDTISHVRVLEIRSMLNKTILYNVGDDLYNKSLALARSKFGDLEAKVSNNRKLYLKLLRTMVRFCDAVNRKMGDTYDGVNNIYLEYGMKGLINEDLKMINIIPKILDLVYKNTSKLSPIFQQYAMKININYYLKWKNQLIGYINTSISPFLFPIIENILKDQPQELFYSFSTIEKYNEIFNEEYDNQPTELFNYMKKYYSSFNNLNAILEALDCLTNPEHKLKFWLRQISILIEKSSKLDNSRALSNVMTKIDFILKVIEYDVLSSEKNFIGNKIGSYNRKFATDYKKLCLDALNHRNISEIVNSKLSLESKASSFSKLTEGINMAINKSLSQASSPSNSHGIEKLSTFSEYLSQYENSNFMTNASEGIYLPCSDISTNKVMISSFDQHILILSSIRLPKRITIYGNNEKSYSYLIKGCEDLRLDNRIEEIFKVMNDILLKDSTCAKKKINLKTFEVIPMTRKLGMIEWVNDTTPLSGIIRYSMQKLFNEPDWDIKTSPAQNSRLKWYNSRFPSKSGIQEQHFKALHMKDKKEIVNAFRAHENLTPKTALKMALTHFVSVDEAISSRINFMRNYSALSIACYILGIGDRHLENFLINIKTNEIVAIDFGVSFGMGLTQLIPELVPYRLTAQLRNVLFPLGIRGTIRQTMIDSLSSFKNYRESILDYCEVFIKEPLIDWGNTYNAGYKKVEIVKRKLNGGNPIKVMLTEIDSCKKEATKEIIKFILVGDEPDSVRVRTKNLDEVEVEIQVDILNEMASDPNLLGRMWIGWAPFI